MKTPRCVIYFLAGTLPGSALLHLRQLSLFGMISRKTDGILYRHARNVFTSVTVAKVSWFHQIRELSLMYGLPHPIDMLENPLDKAVFKKYVKSKVINYWEIVLREEASALKSLNYFQSHYMSLSRPHVLWSTAGHSSRKVSMAWIQALMLSGRYRSNALKRHWSKSNDGACTLTSLCHNVLEDIQHILAFCPALHEVRLNLLKFTQEYSSTLPQPLKLYLLSICCPSHPQFCQFMLDCSCLPEVIRLTQDFGKDVLDHFFHVTRVWIYSLHRKRMKMLGLWRVPGN